MEVAAAIEKHAFSYSKVLAQECRQLYSPFDLDGTYRLKVTEWCGMPILRSIAAMQITHRIEL